jgi:hypothetical protein
MKPIKIILLFTLLVSSLYLKTYASSNTFTYDFNDGNLNAWDINQTLNLSSNYGNWRIENHILLQDSGFDGVLALLNNNQFATQKTEADFKLNGPSGTSGIVIWFQDTSNFVYIILSNGHVEVAQRLNSNWSTNLYDYNYNINDNRWVHFKLEANSANGELKVYADNNLIVNKIVSTTKRLGQTGIVQGNAGASVDNFILTTNGKPLEAKPKGLSNFPYPINFHYPGNFPLVPSITPTPTPTPTVTVTPTPTPTISPTATPAPQYIISDTSWKYSNSEETGWKDESFDDSSWSYVSAPTDGLCPVSAIATAGRMNQNGAEPMWTQTPVSGSTAYFRKTFSLNSLPQKALLRALFDDDGDIYINGNLVLSSHNGSVEGVQETEVTSYLTIGNNVVAIVGIDSGGCQSIQFELTLDPIILNFATNLPTNELGPIISIPSGFKSITFKVTSTNSLATWVPLVSFDGGTNYFEQHRFGCCNTVTVPILGGHYRFSPGTGTIVDLVTGTLNTEPDAQVLLLGQNVSYPFTSDSFDATGFKTIMITIGGGNNPQNLTGISLQKLVSGTFIQVQHLDCDGGAVCPLQLLHIDDGVYRVSVEGSGTGAVFGVIIRK